MITTCPKCHQLYEAIESEGLASSRLCPRCRVVAEVIDSSEALNRRVRNELDRAKRRDRVVVVTRAPLAQALERSEKAIQAARSR